MSNVGLAVSACRASDLLAKRAQAVDHDPRLVGRTIDSKTPSLLAASSRSKNASEQLLSSLEPLPV